MANRLNDTSSTLNDLIKKSIKLSPGPPDRYRLLATRSNLDTEGKIRRWTFGQKHANMINKTILMVGGTGTGKTSLINTMVNYLLGVKFQDKVWFEITEEDQRDQTESQTSEITAYEIISEERPYFLTIIDTPGFGDTRGLAQDEKVAQNLLKLFQHETGVKDLDAVCLVLKASQNRISDAQRYIFEGVLSLFGKDIEDIIVLLITHSDGGAPTNVLNVVKKEKIPCSKDEENEPVHFLFNNRQSEKQQGKYEHASRTSWEMGERSLEEFYDFLKPRQKMEISLTVSVIKDRRQLEACMQSLKERIKFIEEKEKEFTKNKNNLNQNKDKIKKDKNFLFTVATVYQEKVDVIGGSWQDRKVTSCERCKRNCHRFGCWAAPNAWWCYVMKDDHCTVCQCHHSKHVREGRKYVTSMKEEKVRFIDLKNKYSGKNEKGVTYDQEAFTDKEGKLRKSLKMQEEMMTLENYLKELLDENEKEKKLLVKEAYEVITKLSEIALKPDSVFTLQYLEFLIPRVEESGETAWVRKLKRMQKDAEKESCRSVVGFVSWKRAKIGP